MQNDLFRTVPPLAVESHFKSLAVRREACRQVYRTELRRHPQETGLLAGLQPRKWTESQKMQRPALYLVIDDCKTGKHETEGEGEQRPLDAVTVLAGDIGILGNGPYQDAVHSFKVPLTVPKLPTVESIETIARLAG